MKSNKRRILFLLLAVMFACSSAAMLYACGEDADPGGQQSEPGGSDGHQDVDPDGGGSGESYVSTYVFPEMDLGGRDFVIYNVPEGIWEYYTSLAFEEPPADVLDTAVYLRNRYIEDKFNVNIVERPMPGNDMWNMIPDSRRLLTAGEDVYDAMFLPAAFNGNVGGLLLEGLFHDLRQIDTIDLDQPYWNQTMLKDAMIGTGDSIFYAGSGINIFMSQAGGYVYFNEDLMQDMGLERPYQLVRDDKWTLDAFQQYIREGTQLRGATDFAWDASGQTIYGLVSYENAPTFMLAGANIRFISTDTAGRPVLDIRSERFMSTLTRIGEILNVSNGNYLHANDYSDFIFHYENIFRNGRALFTIGELKAASVFRDMEATFGLLPMPKLDEAQEEYSTSMLNQVPVLVIPHTNPRTEETGAVLDAMAYVSNRDVTPVLFDVTVSQKGLRNEESIDMLELTKNRGSFEIGVGYGWTNDLNGNIRDNMGEGRPMDLASTIDRFYDRINTSIERTLERFD